MSLIAKTLAPVVKAQAMNPAFATGGPTVMWGVVLAAKQAICGVGAVGAAAGLFP